MATNFKEIATSITQKTPGDVVGAQGSGKLPENPLNVLRAPEKQTFALMAKGLSNSEIANKSIISLKTVSSDINNIFKSQEYLGIRWLIQG